jgi:exopolyphosphatase/pppGpp-phosphohydrolase
MNSLGMDSRSVSKVAILRRWVHSRLGASEHERRVGAIAATLVRLTSAMHSLSTPDIRLLKMAAMVHDVGRSVSKKNHPAIGARMLRRGKHLPLKSRQRRALAYLTLYHRGQVPDWNEAKKEILRPGDDAARLRLILAFLRAADSLDSRSQPRPSLTFQVRGRRIRIICRLAEDTAKARKIFSRRKKFRLLEELLDCRVEVTLQSSRRLRLVA